MIESTVLGSTPWVMWTIKSTQREDTRVHNVDRNRTAPFPTDVKLRVFARQDTSILQSGIGAEHFVGLL